MYPNTEATCEVRLYSATIPGIIGLIAAHYWFVTDDKSGFHRFEVWQTPVERNWPMCRGHVQRDLMLPMTNVGGGKTKLVTTWKSNEALRIQTALHNATSTYPYYHKYSPWPGPNSNTYIAWILKQANIKHGLGWNALGKHFHSP